MRSLLLCLNFMAKPSNFFFFLNVCQKEMVFIEGREIGNEYMRTEFRIFLFQWGYCPKQERERHGAAVRQSVSAVCRELRCWQWSWKHLGWNSGFALHCHFSLWRPYWQQRDNQRYRNPFRTPGLCCQPSFSILDRGSSALLWLYSRMCWEDKYCTWNKFPRIFMLEIVGLRKSCDF